MSWNLSTETQVALVTAINAVVVALFSLLLSWRKNRDSQPLLLINELQEELIRVNRRLLQYETQVPAMVEEHERRMEALREKFEAELERTRQVFTAELEVAKARNNAKLDYINTLRRAIMEASPPPPPPWPEALFPLKPPN